MSRSMQIRIAFDDGTTYDVSQDPAFGWYQLQGRFVRLGDRLLVSGIEREVVLTMDLPHATGIVFLPDFTDPRCEACGRKPNPPDADACRTQCEFWGEYARIR